MIARWDVRPGDALAELRKMDAESVQTCVTSPPYWGLRDYGAAGQIGLEPTPGEYVTRLVDVFREVRRVLREDGTLWLNLGDCYANDGKWGGSTGGKHAGALHGSTGVGRSKRDTGLKPKDLVGIPWRVAFALQADGWWLRSDVIWSKPNPMPEPVTDRPTRAHEYLFLLSKSETYFYDADSISEPAVSDHPSGNGYGRPEQLSRGQKQGWADIGGKRNRRSVWTIASEPFPEAHFAVMPTELVRPCVLAGAPEGALVLDPFCGAGTVGVVATRLQRSFIGLEINPEYVALARRRIEDDAPLFNADGVRETEEHDPRDDRDLQRPDDGTLAGDLDQEQRDPG